MIWIPKSVSALAQCVADTVARFSLTGVHVASEPGGRWRATATDGHILAIVRGESSPHPLDEEAGGKLPPVEGLLSSAIIPAKDFSAALKAVPKPKKRRGRKEGEEQAEEKDRQAGILLATPEILLAAGDSVFRCQPVEGKFPDTSLILPRKPAPVSFRVDAFLFAELLKVAGEVARQDGTVGVEILVWGRDKPVGVVAQGPNGVFFDGLIQPLT